MIRQALKPFHDPALRYRLRDVRRQHDQVLDEVNQDELISAGFDATAVEKARSLVTSFKDFIEANKDELEAVRVFYSRPRRAGLRLQHVKELAEALKRPPLGASPERVWAAYQAVEPQAVKGRCGKLVDVIALVRHAVQPDDPIVPFTETVGERFRRWLADQRAAGVEFTADQLRWLDAIRDHIANSLAVEPDDFDLGVFAQLGGLGAAHALFGEKLTAILDDLNARLAA